MAEDSKIKDVKVGLSKNWWKWALAAVALYAFSVYIDTPKGNPEENA